MSVNNRRVMLSVAHGDKYRRQTIVMAQSFQKYNRFWDIVCYSDGDRRDFPWWMEPRPIASLFAPHTALLKAHLTPFDQCEIGRFIAIAQLLKEYDEVLYCDNDLYWYGEYSSGDSGSCVREAKSLAEVDLRLSPHYLDYTVASTHFGLLQRDGIYNIGLMHFRTPYSAVVCDHLVRLVEYNPAFNRLNGKLWMQTPLSNVTYWGVSVEVIPDPGLNVAWWNLRRNDRRLIEREGAVFVQCRGMETPLTAYHFSGKSIKRILNGDAGPIPATLAKAYLAELEQTPECIIYPGETTNV